MDYDKLNYDNLNYKNITELSIISQFARVQSANTDGEESEMWSRIKTESNSILKEKILRIVKTVDY